MLRILLIIVNYYTNVNLVDASGSTVSMPTTDTSERDAVSVISGTSNERLELTLLHFKIVSSINVLTSQQCDRNSLQLDRRGKSKTCL